MSTKDAKRSPEELILMRSDRGLEPVLRPAALVIAPTMHRLLATTAQLLYFGGIERPDAVRMEYRHDQAADNAYFGGDVMVDPATQSFVPNRESQDTVTLGVTAWF
jgi:hypothetical protein